jgi:hypothetical protein
MNDTEVKTGDVVVIPKGTTVAQWGSAAVTKRDKKVKVFRVMELDAFTAAVVHGQWSADTLIVQFFEKSVLNAVRVQDLQKADTQASPKRPPSWVRTMRGGVR